MARTTSLNSRLKKLTTKAGSADKNRMLETLVQKLFQGAVPEDLEILTDQELLHLASESLDLLKDRRPGRPLLRAYNPAAREDQLSNVTVIELINDDMPFLVDSTLSLLAARGFEILLVLHPILDVERDRDGKLRDIAAQRKDAGNTIRESMIHIHVNRIAAKRDREKLIADFHSVLEDVRNSVLDWRTMQAEVRDVISSYQRNPPPVPVEELTEAIAFLQWLLDDNFTFLGLRKYEFHGGLENGDIKQIEDSGLGILRNPDTHVLQRGKGSRRLTPQMRALMLEPAPLFITKSDAIANVHRRVPMDYIGLKQFDSEGMLVGEVRAVGLFTSTAYTRSAREVPLVRRKIANVITRSGLNPDGHSGKRLLNVLEHFPRDELFQVEADKLAQMVSGIVRLEERPRTALFVRQDKFGRFVSAYVYLLRERFNSSIRERIGDLLAEAYEGTVASFSPYFGEGVLVRVHFNIARKPDAKSRPSVAKLERSIAEMVRTWDDRLVEAMMESLPPDEARRLQRKYSDAFSRGYQEAFTPRNSLYDIREIEALGEGENIAVEFYPVLADPPGVTRLKLYHYDKAVSLSDRMPILENMGLSAIEEHSFTLTRYGTRSTRRIFIHEVRLQVGGSTDVDIKTRSQLLEDCFLAVWNGLAENDGYNALVLGAGMEWRDVALLRACSKYLRQTGIPYSGDYMASTMVKHGNLAALLVEMFHTRFQLKNGDTARRNNAAQKIAGKIEEILQGVPSLDEDRIVRRFMNFIMSVLRTNFYQCAETGGHQPTMAFKIDSSKIEELPDPRPYAEIFVYAPDVEGVHLRGGMIARGGLRWSDRPEDFRTEVLGLAKAQNVKNAVIVPVGAKGGFVPKKLPVGGSREDIFAEGTRAYKLFISSLLQLTDNLVEDKLVPPDDVIRFDGNDPYLVVAADKGTATFSDTANALSQEHNFWLDDAFASGGSAGYDHKVMGITARGGWEAVKRHFREMNHDTQREPFTVAGVGDMSGDVFGNGMLLSDQIKLVAAFDHRDIFIDPDPDPATSFAERKRLFEMGRSSWQDYNTELLSKGGGIFSRQLKSIPISPEIRKALDLKGSSATPNEILRAIMKAPVDLMWFGGIGTYIRASTESDIDAGDRSNDAIRVTALDVRAKVIGEGANLGVTQRGRIEFAQNGGRINTDAVDNSAGVNSSDVEVNIKIALAAAEQSGKLNRKQRNRLLADMTDEVAELVLRNNYLQTLCLTMSDMRGLREVEYLSRLMRDLESRGLLNRRIEFLPDDGVIADRMVHDKHLTRPEVSVLMAYAKIVLFDSLLASDAIDDPYFTAQLFRYFPERMQKKYAGEISAHRLRREIIATLLSNSMINRGGPAFILRMKEETGHNVAEVARAFAVARDSFQLVAANDLVDALDNRIDGTLQTQLYVLLQRILRRATIWFLRNETFTDGLEKTIEHYHKGIEDIGKNLKTVLPAHNWQRIQERVKSYTERGVPGETAEIIAGLRYLLRAPDIVQVAVQTGQPATTVAKAYFAAGIELGVDRLILRSDEIDTSRYYDKLAVNRTLDGVLQSLRMIVTTAVTTGPAKGDGWKAWSEAHAEPLTRVQNAMEDLFSEHDFSLAKLAVAASQLGDLAVEPA